MVVVAAAVLGLAVMFMPGSLVRRKKIALDDRQRFEASLLAGDILEIGKYFLLYERVMFIKDPIHLKAAGNGAATRGECLRSVWGQSYGTFRVGQGNMKDACGITGVNGSFQGALELACGGGLLSSARKKTFCPGLIRDPHLSGDMFEGMRFKQWMDRGIMTKPPPRPGVYQLVIEVTDAFKPSQQDQLFVRMYHGQKFLDEMFRAGEKNSPLQAWLIYEFMSGEAAFKSAASERYVKVIGKITFKGARGAGHFAERSETMMLVPSTPKDFALFMPFPDKGNIVSGATVTNEPTTLFSQATNLSPSVKIYGRTYFNGDIDMALDDLPEFNESVALSGNLKNGAGVIPGPGDLPLLKQKFKKGFITNVSAARFILDGDCAGNGGPTATPIRISNGTGFNCKTTSVTGAPAPFGIVDYVQPLNGCWNNEMQVTAGARNLVPPLSSTTCTLGTNLATDFAAGGYREITATGIYSPVMSPTKRLTAIGNAQVYGTVMGGHITAGGAAKFYSVSSLFAGLPGIGSDATLVQTNSSAATSYQGVSVAVPNLPLVLMTGEEGK